MGRILGIDYGTSGVGLAISDEHTSFAFPLEILRNDAFLLENIVHVVAEKNISEVAMGDTRAENGAANRVTPEADAFAQELERRAGVRVHVVREAWSSLEASRFAPKGRERDDAASAAIILQRYLDSVPKKP